MVNGNAAASLTATVTDGNSFTTPGTFASSLELTALDGSNGFVINGVAVSDASGRYSISSAGDVNGDGIDDILIGAPLADPSGNFTAGASYVVFGSSSGFSSSLDLSSLDGSNGFVLNGIDFNDQSGRSLSSAGDLNGDGIDDILVGARDADPNGNGSGESYVVFGSTDGFSASIEASSLNGTNGFTINGIGTSDISGYAVSDAGDVNGDGIDDILIGAIGANGGAGATYVVFGSSSGFSANLELSALNGTNGFVLDGIDGSDFSGGSVSSGGDVNGDGIDDIIIGADRADPNGGSSGETYVVFGSTDGFNASFALSSLAAGDGSTGFVLNGIDNSDVSGRSVSAAGDVNGDGIDDIIIGADGATPNGFRSGETYVVFGSTDGFSGTFELSTLAAGDGSTGFVLNGISADDESGRNVAGVGDINGDGFDDIIIGAANTGYAYIDYYNVTRARGEAYVLFGGSDGFSATIELSDLNGANGFSIAGIDEGDELGRAVSSAGDVNGDGIDDFLVGAGRADPGGNTDAGETYVVFGRGTIVTSEASATSTVNINAVNDAPTITGLPD